MAKATTVKCPECGAENEKENAIKYKTRYYCPQCLEKKKVREDKNTSGWDELYEYMKDLYGNVSIKMITQIAKYRKEPYDFTNKGMELTLYYYHELLENPINEEAIGLIPYYYEKAKNEYVDNMAIHEYNSSVKLKQNVKRIKVNPTKNTMDYKSKLIDLDRLGVREDE